MIAKKYARLVVDGKIPNNGDVPEKYLDNLHVSKLSSIYLNGSEMTYDNVSNPYSSLNLSTKDYKFCWYNNKLKSYMMAADVGIYSKTSSLPLIIAEYTEALGGDWSITKKGIEWNIGNNHWVINYKRDSKSRYITDFKVKKNGKILNIKYTTAKNDSNINSCFCVGLKLEDFAKLFDLEYQIDEKSGCVYFTNDSR